MNEQWERFVSDWGGRVSRQIALEAPVQYWTTKRVEHEGKARKWGICSLLGIVLGSILIVILAKTVYLAPAAMNNFAATQPSRPADGSIVAGLGGFLELAVITSFVVWLVRLLVRNYNAEKHLHEDANGRAVLMQAYLAVAAKVEVSDKEREIITSAMFIPTASGLAKEDVHPLLWMEVLRGFSGRG